MYILDTNVISEVLKPKPDVRVIDFLRSIPFDELFLTSVTKAEILFGIYTMIESKRKKTIQEIINKVLDDDFSERILPFDTICAEFYARIVSARTRAGHPISQFDAQIASIASVHNAVLATRNTKDFERCGIETINPWVG